MDLDRVGKAYEFNLNNAPIARAQAKAQQFLRDYQGPWERTEIVQNLSSDFNMYVGIICNQ